MRNSAKSLDESALPVRLRLVQKLKYPAPSNVPKPLQQQAVTVQMIGCRASYEPFKTCLPDARSAVSALLENFGEWPVRSATRPLRPRLTFSAIASWSRPERPRQAACLSD